MEICLGVDDVTKESLSVVTKQQTSMGDIMVGVSYRLPDQDEQGDEVFYRHLKVASGFQVLVLAVFFNHPNKHPSQQGISCPAGLWRASMTNSQYK